MFGIIYRPSSLIFSNSIMIHTHSLSHTHTLTIQSLTKRLQPIDLGDDYTDSMINELHCRLFFKLCLDDA